MTRASSVLSLLVAAALAACGGSGTFGLSSADNNPELLRAAFDRRQPPTAGKPVNELGKPMVFLVAAEKGKTKIVAYDLAGSAVVWQTDADVKSRLVVGSGFVAHVDGKGEIVGYDVATGKRSWSHGLEGNKFLGLTADGERVYFVVQSAPAEWTLSAVSGANGELLWSAPSPGQLGTPAARGGLVFSPFLKQWLVVLDARTGEQLARIRGIDEEIVFVRDTSAEVYYGSKAGVFLLDERAASGKRAESTYGSASLPKEFVRSFYHWDAFDLVQAGYSAYDRNRILWRASAAGDALAFTDDRVIVHNYRFFFGFDANSGQLVWAYNNPRVDAVASDHLGGVIGFVSMLGDVGALDPKTGAKVFEARIEIKGTVRGATFDADGWLPGNGGEAADTAKALVSIARDRDARFLDVKLFALTALGKISGGDVAGDLLALIQDEKTPPKVYDKAVQVLVERRDAAAVPHFLATLAVRYDFITGAKPKAIGVVARAIAALGDLSANDKVDAAARGALVEALTAHLFSPQTPAPELTDLVKALGATGLPGTLVPLRRFLVTYRADPAFSTQVASVGATIDTLLAAGGVAERELVAFVAADARTQPGVAEYAASALRQSDLKREAARKGAAASAPASE